MKSFFVTFFMVIMVLFSPVSLGGESLSTSSRNGLTVVPGVVNDAVQLDFIIDTGSTFTIIGKSSFEAIQERTNPIPIRAAKFSIANGGDLILFLYEVSSIRVGNCNYENVEVAVNLTDELNMIGWSLINMMGDITFREDKRFDISECPK